VDGLNVTVDLNGNLTYGPLTNDNFSACTFDVRNRLLNAGGVTNVYDAMNNRIGQTYGTNSIVYIVNPNAKLPQVLERIKNGVTTYYIYGAGLLYQITETATATNTLTYHYDYRGSTIALSGDNGLVTDRMEYSLYATLTYRVGTNDTPFLFNGRYGVMTDPNSLLYMCSRYYNPYICRFLNPDPSGFAGGLNLYAFANGNPVSYLDPFGLGAVGGESTSTWIQLGNVLTSGDTWWGHLLYTGQLNPSDDVMEGAVNEAGSYVYDNSPVRGAYVYGGLDAHTTTPGIGGGYQGELIGLGGYDVNGGTFAGGLGAAGTGPVQVGFERTTGESGFNPIVLVDSPQTTAGQGIGGFVSPGSQGQLQVGIYYYQQVGRFGVVGGGFYFDANKLGNYLNSDYWNGTMNPNP
jgi:RHS repeat-associated protein